jgi:hypothetical protein
MHTGWILNPSAAGLAVVAGLALALALALFLITTAKVRVRLAQRPAAPPSEFEEVRRRLADLEARRAVPDTGATAMEPPNSQTVSVRPGMNLSRRSQALRLARRGESPEQIASILGLATGEVRLLLKIHGVLMQQVMTGPRHIPLKLGQDSADILSSADKADAHAAKPL